MWPSCWLSSHRSFGVRIWRRIRCRSSTVCFRSNSGYCTWGEPYNEVTGHFNSAAAALCGYVKTAARETVVENHRLSFDEVGRLQTNCAFCQHVLQRVETDRRRLEILSRCGQRFAKTIDEAVQFAPVAGCGPKVACDQCGMSSPGQVDGDEALIAEAERTAAILP